MGLEKSANKLRRAAERRSRNGEEARRQSDTESAEAHGELIERGAAETIRKSFRWLGPV